jgi:hypothetical protein
MQLGAVLDTVIGISFVFFLLALASSAVAEWLATVFKKRAKYLLRGLRDMLDASAPAGVREWPDSFVARLGEVVDRSWHPKLWAPFLGVSQERAMHRQAQRLVSQTHRTTARDKVVVAMQLSAVGQPAVGQPAVGQPAAAEPVVDLASVERGQAASEALMPGAGQPDVGQPAVGQPDAGQPARIRRFRSFVTRSRQRREHERGRRAEKNADFPNIPNGLALVLTHPLVAGQAQTRTTGEVSRLPAYVDAKTFATVVLDALTPDGHGATSVSELAAKVKASQLPNPLKDALLAATTTGQETLDHVRADLERWYDTTMERVSGSYKRWIKRWIIVIAALFVLVLHVDTLHVASTLYTDPAVRQAAATIATSSTCKDKKVGAEQKMCLDQTRSALVSAGLPIGPPGGCSTSGLAQAPWHKTWWRAAGTCLFGQDNAKNVDTGRWPLTMLGLLLSVLATTFGAPFWFQLLTRAANLRNTGSRPASSAESKT